MSKWIKSEIDASSLRGQDDCYPALKFQQGRWCPGSHLSAAGCHGVLEWAQDLSPEGAVRGPARLLLHALLPMGFLSGAGWHLSATAVTPLTLGQQPPTLAGCPRGAAGWEHCRCGSRPRKCLSFSNIFTAWSMGKLRSWLNLQWKTLFHYKEPLKLNGRSRV